MNEFIWILAATLAGGLLSVLLAAILSFHLNERISHQLVAFAAGVMLSAACLDILPEAQEAFALQTPSQDSAIFVTLLGGLLLFYLLERLALWRHAHPEHENMAPSLDHSAATLILIGDAFHNFVDGVLIAAAFLTSPELGLATTLAIIAHEIPQELGDFVILLNAGWRKSSALIANAACSLTAVFGGVLGYFSLQSTQTAIPFALTLAASSFIYIAVADLLPMLKHQRNSRFIDQASWLFIGVAIIPAMSALIHAH